MEELSDSEVDALDALQGDEEKPTETVSFGDAEIEVLAHHTGELEDIISELNELEPEHAIDYRDLVIDAITEVVVEEQGPHDFENRAVWEAYWNQNGIVKLFKAFNDLVSPALESTDAGDVPKDDF